MKNAIVIFFLLISHFALAQDDLDAIASLSDLKSSKVYSQNGRMGLQKNLNKPITPALYDTLFMINSTRYVGKRFNTTKQQSYWGVISESGEKIIPFNYRVLHVSHSLIIVGVTEQNLMKFGVFTVDGDKVLSPIYESLEILNNQLISSSSNGRSIIFDRTGSKILELKADSISLLYPDHIKFNKVGKVGVRNLSNELIVTPDFRNIKMKDDEIWVKNLPEWHVINGYDTLSLRYDNILPWQENYITSIANKSFLIDSENKLLSNPYDTIIRVNPSFSIVSDGELWGIIDSFGKEIIPVSYTQILNDEEIIYAKGSGSSGKWLLFDFYGFRKTKLKYDSIKTISDGRIGIQRNGKWGFIDRYGIEVISPIFNDVQQFNNGLAIVNFYGEEGIIDKSGKWEAIPFPVHIIGHDNSTMLAVANGQYQIKSFSGELIYFTRNKLVMKGNNFSEYDSTGIEIRRISKAGTFDYGNIGENATMAGGAGLVIFKKDGKYGFKDQQNRIVIANRYEAVKPFHQRVAAIKINNKWGFINLDEELIIQPRYDSVGHFINNSCIIKRDGMYGVLKPTGEEVIKTEYQRVIPLLGGQFRVKRMNLWGVLNENGAVVIHPKYDKLEPVNQSFYIVEKRNLYGTINTDGVSKIPLLYDFISYDTKSKTLVTKLSYKNEWTFLMKAHSINN